MSNPRYTAEMRERAVKMVMQVRRESGQEKGAIARVAQQLGIGREALRGWVAQAEVDSGARPGTTSDDKQRIKELERENSELRRANEILKRVSVFREGTRPEPAALAGFIDAHRGRFGIELACAVLGFPVSSYYFAKNREDWPSARDTRDAMLKTR